MSRIRVVSLCFLVLFRKAATTAGFSPALPRFRTSCLRKIPPKSLRIRVVSLCFLVLFRKAATTAG